MNVRTRINSAQEMVNERVNEVQETGRKVARTSVGLLGLAYDEARSYLTRAQELLNKAEQRGGRIEEQTIEEARKYYQQAESRISQAQNEVMNRVRSAEKQVENEVEIQIEQTLDKMNVPTMNKVADLNNQIDKLNEQIDGELAKMDEEPMKGYDKLTAKEIASNLEGLTVAELYQVRKYETVNDNRVTVLREVDRLIEAMPIARYDDLTVDEIEPMLSTLNAEQLEYVKTYEKAHENRVTLLREIDSKLKDRKEASAA